MTTDEEFRALLEECRRKMNAEEAPEPLIKEIEENFTAWLNDGHHDFMKFFLNIYYITSGNPNLISGLLNTKFNGFQDGFNYAEEGFESIDMVRTKLQYLENPDIPPEYVPHPLLVRQCNLVRFYLETRSEFGLIRNATPKNPETGRLTEWGNGFADKLDSINNLPPRGIWKCILSRTLNWEDARYEIACVIPAMLQKAAEHTRLLIQGVIDNDDRIIRRACSDRNAGDPKRYLTSLQELCGFMIHGDIMDYEDAKSLYNAIEISWDYACGLCALRTFMEGDEPRPCNVKQASSFIRVYEFYRDHDRQDIIDFITELGRKKGIEDVYAYLTGLRCPGSALNQEKKR